MRLAFGYNAGLPEDASAAWGARLIWPNDLLHDRQDLQAADEEAKRLLIDWLNGDPMGTGAIQKMRDALRAPGELGLDYATAAEVVIYEDDTGKIVGNSNGSHGYVYVVGYLKEPAEGDDG